jgi:ABC-type phosphate/phosphonate transport system substrate-binding protein
MSKQSLNELQLQQAAKPLMDYLKSLGHPHYTVIVTSDSAELVEGILMYRKAQEQGK